MNKSQRRIIKMLAFMMARIRILDDYSIRKLTPEARTVVEEIVAKAAHRIEKEVPND